MQTNIMQWCVALRPNVLGRAHYSRVKHIIHKLSLSGKINQIYLQDELFIILCSTYEIKNENKSAQLERDMQCKCNSGEHNTNDLLSNYYCFGE